MVVVWCCHQALCNTWWHPRHPNGHVLTTLCPTATTTPVLSGVSTRATTSPHPSPRVCVCVTVALSHPPCPQVWSSTPVHPASPPQITTFTRWMHRVHPPTRAHTEKKEEGKKKAAKKDYDTWCSQVVSNPSTNQARRGLTSLIRREVVLSSWCGRNNFYKTST